MTARQYLQDQLTTCAQYELTAADQTLLDQAGVEGYIYTKLTSKKFRKWAVDIDSEKQIKKAIHICVSQSRPLEIRYPFGGYKLWSMPGAPEVDWAEFFSVSYYLRYLAPIAAAYEPGLNLVFASDDVIIERMDNVPAADTAAYFASFQKLLDTFRAYLLKNVGVSIQRVGDLYEDKQSMEQELASNIEPAKTFYENPQNAAQKAVMTTTSALNIQWNGAKDMSHLSDSERQAVIDMGPVYHDAYCALGKRRELNRGEDKILIFTTRVPLAVAVGTTKSTITKFWTGFGVLEKAGDGYQPKILSPRQLEQWKERQYNDEPVGLIDLKNFSSIQIAGTVK